MKKLQTKIVVIPFSSGHLSYTKIDSLEYQVVSSRSLFHQVIFPTHWENVMVPTRRSQSLFHQVIFPTAITNIEVAMGYLTGGERKCL